MSCGVPSSLNKLDTRVWGIQAAKDGVVFVRLELAYSG
jgi:hypothetical protein